MLIIDLRRIRRWTLIVIGVLLLAVIFLLTQRTIETNLRMTTDEIKYKDYIGLNGIFLYKLPSEWKTVEQDFGGREILYHNDFATKDGKMHGYVEVWNLNKPLINFIKEGQKSAVGIVSFKNYTIEPIKIDNKQGYILQYSRRDEKNKYFKAFEVFILDGDNTFSRFAFYMEEPLWKDEYRALLMNIAASTKWNR